MGLERSQAIRLTNNVVDTVQTFLPDDSLIQGGVDAFQKLVSKALDDTPNGPQFKEALQKVIDAINNWQESGEG